MNPSSAQPLFDPASRASESSPPLRHSATPFQRALRLKDLEMLRQLRHTLRTPLNQIIGYSELLLESIDESERRLVADLNHVHTAGGQILAMVNDALAPWKLETGNIDLMAMRRHALDPLNVIIGYSEICYEDAVEQQRKSLADDLNTICTAARNLHRILGDESLPDRIEVASASANLGLAAQAVLGDTTIEKPDTPGVAEVAGAPPAPSRVLIVDDDPLNRDMLGRRLNRLGYEVNSAPTGQLALELLHQRPFDVVLLDIVMPEFDGFQTLEAMKADAQLRHLPVIMLTALDEVDSTVRTLEAGAEDYVPKPFNPVILNARIAASLEKKRLRDQEQAWMRELEAERSKSERLLLNTLPKAIADRLKAGERVIVDSFSEATVLFADIAGFARIAAEMAPARTVQLLNEIFSAIDRLAETHQVEKIKTIGDAYMAVAGVPLAQPSHAEGCANLALGILETIKAFNQRHGLDWHVRVGVHSGPLVAGIIGTKKFSYDLWGDTVNIASRMQSQGAPDCIQISATTRELLSDHFTFEERGTLEMKNRGPMAVYHLQSRRA